MKYLVSPAGSPLVFDTDGSAGFVALDGTKHATGKVAADTTEAYLKRLCAAAMPKMVAVDNFGQRPEDPAHPFAWMEPKDLMRDLRFIGKFLAAEQVAVGAEGVGVKASRGGVTLTVPQGASERETYEPKVGDAIAVGANISPKALMNARGIVTAVNGAKVTVRLNAGDLRRVEAATGKRFGAEARLPKVCVEREEA